jgi:hypothetical protein
MPYVSIKPSGGFGNQMFQIAAMLGYAERYGHTPVFIEKPRIGWEHAGRSAFDMSALFNNIPVLTKTVAWNIVKEPVDAAFSYIELPAYHDEHVLLEGYFQSDRYGPSDGMRLLGAPSGSLHPALIPHNWSSTFFLHVRRTDYLHPANAHHRVDLVEYYRECLRRMRLSEGRTCFVVSDDIDWCRRELPGLLPGWQGEWLFCPPTISDAETFFWMTACGLGGICANSTFSWWAAYFLHRLKGAAAAVQLFMPAVWGHPPLPPARDIHPPWATAVGLGSQDKN